MKNLVCAVVAGVIVSTSAYAQNADSDKSGKPKDIYVYPVKYACDEFIGQAFKVTNRFRTVINIYNPGVKPINACFRVLEADDPGEFQDKGSQRGIIRALNGLAETCGSIRDGFFGKDRRPDDGFFVIETTAPLKVTAVYTTCENGPKQECGDLDVETVKPHIEEKSRRPLCGVPYH